MRLLAITGSLRRDSHSRGLLRAAQELAPAGVEVELYDGWGEAPAFNEDLEADPPAAVERMRRRIADADGLLIATPEYNGTLPGGLKNALDWASRPHGESVLMLKPVAVLGSSPWPFGAATAAAQLRLALKLSGAAVLDQELAIGRVAQRFGRGKLTDGETRAQLAGMVAELAAAVRGAERDAPPGASEPPVVAPPLAA